MNAERIYKLYKLGIPTLVQYSESFELIEKSLEELSLLTMDTAYPESLFLLNSDNRVVMEKYRRTLYYRASMFFRPIMIRYVFNVTNNKIRSLMPKELQDLQDIINYMVGEKMGQIVQSSYAETKEMLDRWENIEGYLKFMSANPSF